MFLVKTIISNKYLVEAVLKYLNLKLMDVLSDGHFEYSSIQLINGSKNLRAFSGIDVPVNESFPVDGSKITSGVSSVASIISGVMLRCVVYRLIKCTMSFTSVQIYTNVDTMDDASLPKDRYLHIRSNFGFSFSFVYYLYEINTTEMSKIQHILSIIALTLAFEGCQQKESVDLILKNAKIYTMNNSFAVMQCAAIRNGKFIAISNDANIFARYTSDSILNLKGKYVYPGFIDAHAHFVDYALSLDQIDLTDADSISTIINLLTDFHKRYPKERIVAKGLDESLIADSLLGGNNIFNTIFPKTPIFIWGQGYDFALINNAFEKEFKISLSPGYGIIDADEAKLAFSLIPRPSDERIAELLKQAEQDCFDVGITSTTDFGCSYEDVQLIDKLQKSGSLKIPVYAILEPSAKNTDEYLRQMPYYTEQLKVLAVGLDIDGRLCQQQSVMMEPYTEDAVNGKLRISIDSLQALCQLAFDHGFQVCIGSSGDSATRITIKTFADILPHKNNLRWRIENIQMIRHKDLRHIGHFNIIPSILPAQYQQNLPLLTCYFNKKTAREAFSWKQLLDQNQGIICGSNAPYGDMNPMSIYQAATHQEKRRVTGKQSQELTPAQALKSMTIWAAYSQFDDKQKGSIEVGKWADFIITDENIMTSNMQAESTPAIESTYLHGKRVK